MQICNKRGEIYKLCALFFTESSNSIGLEGGGQGGGGVGERERIFAVINRSSVHTTFSFENACFENGDFRKRFQMGRRLKTPYFENGSFLVWTG